MSDERDYFDAAARRSEWDRAFGHLNILSMYEMLRALDSLPPDILRGLHQNAYRYFGKVGVLRIEWAYVVVVEHRISLPAPGDLAQTNQVRDAEDFLREKQPPAATLSFRDAQFSSSQYSGPGGFARAIVWQLNGAHKGTNGHIVQKVSNIFNVYRSDGSAANVSKQTYWEAWMVREGAVVSGSIGDVKGGDLLAIDPIPDTRGSWEKHAWAKYIEGYDEPLRWGTEAYFQTGPGLQSTLKEPGPPWSEQGAIYRWYKMTFDGCNGKNDRSLQSWDRKD
jgi:hypothetical protein